DRFRWTVHPDPARPVALVEEHVADDGLTVPSPSSRSFLQFRRNPRGHIIEKSPARPQQPQPSLQIVQLHGTAVQGRRRIRNTPEIGGASPFISLYNLHACLLIEFGRKAGSFRNRSIPTPILLKRIQGDLFGFAPTVPAWPIGRIGHDLLAF